jgi:hypothetical protein
VAQLADAIRQVNERELDANEQAIASCIPPPPALSQENQAGVIEFIQWSNAQRVRACPAKVASVAAFIQWQSDNRRPRETIFASLSAIDALHTAAGVGSPVAAATALTTIAGATIEPPRSWRKDEKEEFLSFPIHAQWIIARREQDRETALRRAQNSLAEERKRLQADAAPKSADNTQKESPHAQENKEGLE